MVLVLFSFLIGAGVALLFLLPCWIVRGFTYYGLARAFVHRHADLHKSPQELTVWRLKSGLVAGIAAAAVHGSVVVLLLLAMASQGEPPLAGISPGWFIAWFAGISLVARLLAWWRSGWFATTPVRLEDALWAAGATLGSFVLDAAMFVGLMVAHRLAAW